MPCLCHGCCPNAGLKLPELNRSNPKNRPLPDTHIEPHQNKYQLYYSSERTSNIRPSLPLNNASSGQWD